MRPNEWTNSNRCVDTVDESAVAIITIDCRTRKVKNKGREREQESCGERDAQRVGESESLCEREKG